MIETERLWLVLLEAEELRRWLAGDRTGVLAGAEDLVCLRLEQLDEDPMEAPWLLRAIIRKEDRVEIGFIGFHAPPDEHGNAELGYEVLPPYQRRGYASEAAAAMAAWAAANGCRTVRASVSPDNAPSIALLTRAGYVQVGEQLDEEDGLELVFEKPAG